MSEAHKRALKKYWANLTPEQKAAHAEKARLGQKKSSPAAMPVEPEYDRVAATRELAEIARQNAARAKALLESDAPLSAVELRGVGSAIRSRRGRLKPAMSQEALAAKLDVSIFDVDLIERGRVGYGHKMLARLARIFGCAASDLLLRSPGDIKGVAPSVAGAEHHGLERLR